jgi:hypothetical protein
MQRKILTCMSLVMLVLMVSFPPHRRKMPFPIPMRNGKGYRARPWPTPNPILSGNPKRPRVRPMCWSLCWTMPVIPMHHPSEAS